MPSERKTMQPAHLLASDAQQAIQQGYDGAYVVALRENPKMLSFEYKHGLGKADRDAMYKYREVIKAFAKINPSGVWNFTTLQTAITKWDNSLGKLLSTNPQFEGGAIRQAATNLLQILQDAHRSKKNVVTGSRTPSWMREIFDLLQGEGTQGQPPGVLHIEEGNPVDEENSEADGSSSKRGFSAAGSSHDSSTRSSEASGSSSKRGFSAVESPHNKQRKRTLRIAISSASDTPTEYYPDQPPEPKQDEPKYLYDWDETNNRGHRMLLGGQWRLCDDIVDDTNTGFMKCIWRNPPGEWLSEVTVVDYGRVCSEANDTSGTVVKRKPAAAKTMVDKEDKETKTTTEIKSNTRKKEYSRVYHSTYIKAKDTGVNIDEAKKKAQLAARKHLKSIGY